VDSKTPAAKRAARRGTRPKPHNRGTRSREPRLPRKPDISSNPESAFAGVFSTYWGAIQAQQGKLLARTQHLYSELMKKLQDSWHTDDAQARFIDASRNFVAAVRQSPQRDDTPEQLGEAYAEYVEMLRDAWAEPAMREVIENAYLSFSEELQRANESSQQALEAARQAYLEQLRIAWLGIDPDTLSEQTMNQVSINMMATVFFMNGVRAPENLATLDSEA
jgi:hypothetical protein